jgi:hypothetical protein
VESVYELEADGDGECDHEKDEAERIERCIEMKERHGKYIV